MGKSGRGGRGSRESRPGHRGKRTRFHLTRKGETALAWTGGVVVVVVLAVLLFWARGHLLPADPAEAKRLADLEAKDAAVLQGLKGDGTVLEVRAQEEEVLVDPARWLARSATEREQAAGSVARVLKLRRVFFDGSSGQRIGWYLEGAGYKEPPKTKPEP